MPRLLRILLVTLIICSGVIVIEASAQVQTTVCRVITQAGAVSAKCPSQGRQNAIVLPGLALSIIDTLRLAKVSPAPSPSSSPASGTFMGFSSTASYPTTFTPYASTSVFNTPLSSNPTAVTTNTAILAVEFPGGTMGGGNAIVRVEEAGANDYNHPTFYPTNNDPVVSAVCNVGVSYCLQNSGGYTFPATFHIPAHASGARGSDGHMDLVEPDGTELSFWEATRLSPGSSWTNGQVVQSATMLACGPWPSAPGFNPNGVGQVAASFCDHAGILTANELISGYVPHMMFIVNTCSYGTPQYPSPSYAAYQTCTNGVGPTLGSIQWLNIPTATLDAIPTCTAGSGTPDVTCWWPWEHGILRSMHVYGAIFADYGGGAGGSVEGNPFVGFNLEPESEEPYYDAAYNVNYTSPYAPLAAQGWIATTPTNNPGLGGPGVRWIPQFQNSWNPLGVNGINSNWGAHIFWLQPCAALHTC